MLLTSTTQDVMLPSLSLLLASLSLSIVAYSQSDLFGNFPRADGNTNGSCGPCQIVFFPYLVAWNESTKPDGSYANVTVVAPVLVTIDNSTNITSTQTMSAQTENVLINGDSATSEFTITVSNGSPGTTSTAGNFLFTSVITSPSAFIWWGAWSVRGPYQTLDSTGGTICTTSATLDTKASTGLPVPFTSMTTYPISAQPSPYTGIPVPTSSYSDVPFGTAEAEAFLGLFPTISAFASCIPISYSGAPLFLTRANGFLTTSYTLSTTYAALPESISSSLMLAQGPLSTPTIAQPSTTSLASVVPSPVVLSATSVTSASSVSSPSISVSSAVSSVLGLGGASMSGISATSSFSGVVSTTSSRSGTAECRGGNPRVGSWCEAMILGILGVFGALFF